MTDRQVARAVRGERGAVLPEYALVIALVVVASIGAILAVLDKGEDRLGTSDVRIGNPVDGANYAAAATITTLQSSSTTSSVVGQTVRVGAITNSPSPSQGSPASKWIANATVTALDGSGTPVAGVVVSGSWSSNGLGQSGTCTTNAGGTCAVQRADLNDGTPTETFTVTGMSKSGFTFVPGATDFVAVPCSPPLSGGCD